MTFVSLMSEHILLGYIEQLHQEIHVIKGIEILSFKFENGDFENSTDITDINISFFRRPSFDLPKTGQNFAATQTHPFDWKKKQVDSITD